jgi:hypothetical protein
VCVHAFDLVFDYRHDLSVEGGELELLLRRPAAPLVKVGDGRRTVERIVRTLRVDGHEVAVIEMIEEDASSFVLCVDESVINADAPLPAAPSDADICATVLHWTQRP